MRDFSGCHAQCHWTLSEVVARLCRIRSPPFPLITSFWLVHRPEQRLSSCEIMVKVLFLEMAPYAFPHVVSFHSQT